MAAAAVALGSEIFGQGFRFQPTPYDAVTYYLPRLVAGEPLHDAVRPVVHHGADVYACAPADLARRFRPLPRTGDRFFFTSKRPRAASRAGSWQAQTTTAIKARGEDDAKIGELRKLRYKTGGVYTDWLMEEYSSVAGDGGGEGQFVLCKMYVSPRAAPTSAAHKESAAYFSFTLPPPAAAAVVMQPAAAPKRPAIAPPQPAVSPPCAKRMRVAAVQPAPPPQPPAPPAPTLPSSLAAVRMMPFTPPQPFAPPRSSTTPLSRTQPSPASAPPAPTRAPIAAVRKLSFAPPQPCAPRRGSTTPSATPPSHRSPAPPQPLPQKVPPLLPTPLPVVRACHVPEPSKQRRILDPFEAAMLSDEAEEQTVPAPPPPAAAAATPALQDGDDWDDLAKALEFDLD